MTDINGFAGENRIVFPTVEPGFEHGVEQTVLSGPGLQLLNPGPRDSYQHRLHDVEGSVSELFQANARWRLCDLNACPSEQQQREMRQWFLESGRTYLTVDDTRPQAGQTPLATIPAPLGRPLAALARLGADSGIFYASDIVVVWADHTWLLPAGGEHLVRMRRFDEGQRRDLNRSVPPDKRDAFSAAEAVLSVTTVPWRVEIMQGPRGFRVALQQSGLLLAATTDVFRRAQAAPVVTTEFADVVVDRVLDQDGVERFTTALIAVSTPTGDGPTGQEHP